MHQEIPTGNDPDRVLNDNMNVVGCRQPPAVEQMEMMCSLPPVSLESLADVIVEGIQIVRVVRALVDEVLVVAGPHVMSDPKHEMPTEPEH